MSFKNTDELSRAILSLKLVDAPKLKECKSQLGPEQQAPADLLRVLEQHHYLTSYQVGKLKKGETDGLVLGRYKLLYRNASGSFARVFRACDVDSGKMMGLKILRQRWASDPEAVSQFHREALLCKPMQHRNIVPIYDVGAQGSYHFFTMEFVEGGNLRDFINIRKQVAPGEASRYALDMSEGLEYALSQGITHRDLKLTNVLMSIDGVAKLVDFGLAGHEQSTDSFESESMQRALEYAAIEKGTGAPNNDPRTDLYFLGAIFYELLTGVSPYERTRDRDERRQLSRYSNIRSIQAVNPTIPRSVADIVSRLMFINPNERYQSATEVNRDLRKVLAELGESPKRSGGRSAAAESKETAMPTVMCIETRVKQQDLLREYLSKHGFRVLMLSDLQRGLSRISNNPPDCIIMMGESLGDGVIDGFQQASKASSVISILVLSEEQKEWKGKLAETETARVLAQPITLRDLRRELHHALQLDQAE